LPLTRSFPTSLFRPPSARQRRREKSGTGPCNPRSREEPFLDPPGPRPAFGRPGSPERDCGPGCQNRNRPELSMPRTQFRASCTARVFLEITGPGPGETDSGVSLRHNPAACWTRMEDPHVKAGAVVIRKNSRHGTIRRGRFIKSRPEQFLLHSSVKASSASTRSRNQTAVRLWFPLQTLHTSHRQLFFRICQYLPVEDSAVQDFLPPHHSSRCSIAVLALRVDSLVIPPPLC
jgi:hypothetical protein